jgi:GT2 family glycosyltransferase
MNDDARLLTPKGFTAMQEACGPYAGTYLCSAAITDAIVHPSQLPQRGSKGLRLELDSVLAFVCALLPAAARKKVGPLNESFRFYGFDDNDYCRRAMACGIPLFIFDGCHVEHGILPSTYAKETGRNCRPNAEIYSAIYRGRLLPQEENFIRGLGVKL